jgi:hypothetical protein
MQESNILPNKSGVLVKKAMIIIIPVLAVGTLLPAMNDYGGKSNAAGSDTSNHGFGIGLASHYTNDVGIEKDADVLFTENFEDNIDEITARYNNVVNKSGMSTDADVPSGSRGLHSLKMTNTGGKNEGGHLYKRFTPGFDSIVFVRYYVKYPATDSGYIHHESIWIGGYDPALDYPSPKASICHVDGRLSVSYEPSERGKQMDNYIYWPGMKNSSTTRCYGNVLYDPREVQHVNWDKWMCIELMIKLNNPVTASNGELAIWKDGVLVNHWRPGFPAGNWKWGFWIASDSGQNFEGFQWRRTASLNINYIWIEYFDDFSPAGVINHIKYDHIIIAKKYIGPIKQ